MLKMFSCALRPTVKLCENSKAIEQPKSIVGEANLLRSYGKDSAEKKAFKWALHGFMGVKNDAFVRITE